MKRLTALLLILLLLTGCTTAVPATEPSLAPTTTPTEPTLVLLPTETEAPTEPALDGLRAHFIDVGQADCILLECDGEYAIIDAGYPERADEVVDYMAELGVEELSLLVATHPHGDHIGGLPAVLEAYPVETVWSSELPFSNDYTPAENGCQKILFPLLRLCLKLLQYQFQLLCRLSLQSGGYC